MANHDTPLAGVHMGAKAYSKKGFGEGAAMSAPHDCWRDENALVAGFLLEIGPEPDAEVPKKVRKVRI